jgi:hypothetical protein
MDRLSIQPRLGNQGQEIKMKIKITVYSNNVTVERDDQITGERESVTYFVPRIPDGKPGYVRIRDAAGRYPQVCEKLYGTGNTLMATPETLPAVIRRELRRRVAAERRELIEA